jgi:hypothetical protein
MARFARSSFATSMPDNATAATCRLPRLPCSLPFRIANTEAESDVIDHDMRDEGERQ